MPWIAKTPLEGEKKVVRVWHTETEPQTIAAVQEIINDFEKLHPDITIRQEGLAWGDLEAKLTAALAPATHWAPHHRARARPDPGSHPVSGRVLHLAEPAREAFMGRGLVRGMVLFILAWNDYIFTRILIASDELKTLPVGVQDLFNSAIVDWGLIMAAGMMITIPALIFFVSVQRYLIRGWGAGAVKG